MNVVFDPAKWKTPNTYDPKTFASLPASSAVYLLVRIRWAREGGMIDYEVLYAGMSTNLASRLKKHEVKEMCERQCTPTDAVAVFFRKCPPEALRRREKKLIKAFNPPWNLQHRVRGI